MQYMMMCCIEEKRWIAELEERGQHRMSARLAPSGTAHTIRQQGGRRVVIDGPFAETKEQFGGYHLVECRDLDEAVALAERIPTLPHGGVVEVRAVEPER